MSSSSAPPDPLLFAQGDVISVQGVVLSPSDDPDRRRGKLDRILLDGLPQVLGLLDAEGRLVDVNRAACEWAGLGPDRAPGLPFWEGRWLRASREAQERVRDGIRRAARGEVVRCDLEVFGEEAGGGRSVIDFSLAPIRDRDGEVVLLLAEARNPAERDRAQGTRQTAGPEAPVGRLSEIDLTGARAFASPARRLGDRLARLLGPVMRMLAEDDLSGERRRGLEELRDGAVLLLRQVEDLLALPGPGAGAGAPDAAPDRATPGRPPSPGTAGAGARGADLEDLAREVARSQRDLRDALDAARLALGRADAAAEAKGDFIRLVSHELRSPLSSVVLHLDLLRRAGEGSWSPRQLELLDRVQASSRRLGDVVAAVLDQSRIGRRGFALELEEVDPAALAAEVLRELRPEAEAKGLCLLLEGGPDLTLRSDPCLLRLILRHLAENAIKFTDRGHVRVTLDRRGEGLGIAIADTGRGIAPEDRSRIFEPFDDGGDVRHKHEAGMGLGLSIVRQAVEALGGRIAVESEPGRGSTFAVTLAPAAGAEGG